MRLRARRDLSRSGIEEGGGQGATGEDDRNKDGCRRLHSHGRTVCRAGVESVAAMMGPCDVLGDPVAVRRGARGLTPVGSALKGRVLLAQIALDAIRRSASAPEARLANARGSIR